MCPIFAKVHHASNIIPLYCLIVTYVPRNYYKHFLHTWKSYVVTFRLDLTNSQCLDTLQLYRISAFTNYCEKEAYRHIQDSYFNLFQMFHIPPMWSWYEVVLTVYSNTPCFLQLCWRCGVRDGYSNTNALRHLKKKRFGCFASQVFNFFSAFVPEV